MISSAVLCGPRPYAVAKMSRLANEGGEPAPAVPRALAQLSKAMASIIKDSGFRWATPHSFRRTVATLLDQAGVPIVTIADQLGHTNPAMTASKYLGRDLMGDKPSVAEHL